MAIASAAESVQYFLRRGIDGIQEGKFSSAARDLSLGIARYPRVGLLHAWRGMARFQAGQIRRAVPDFDAALRLDRGTCFWVEPCLNSGLKSLELAPLAQERTVLQWKAGPRALQWRRRLPAMTALFDELEYLTVKCGQRRIMFRNLEVGSPFLERARRDGLQAQALFHVKRYQGFAHQFEFTTQQDPDSWTHTVIAGNRQDAQEAAELYRHGLKIKGHAALGRLLGFPACCVKFFESNFVMARIPDPVFEAAGLTAGARIVTGNSGQEIIRAAGYPECNPLLRYFGLRAVSWIPCSFDCRETRKTAREWLRLGRTLDPEATGQMMELLSQPLKWRCDLGRIQVVSRFFSGTSPSYAPQLPRLIAWRAR